MADLYKVSTPLDGVDVTGGTEKTLLDFTSPTDRRPKILGVWLSTKEIDAALVAAQYRIAVTTVAGSGSSAAVVVSVDPNAPADGLSATYGRVGYTEGTLLHLIGNIAAQAVNFGEILETPVVVPVNTRVALVCDSPGNLTGVHATLLVEV